ncbi:hypothetical protein NUW54_g1898 [Trametes sanguinea]|uniref:Uncharacterized protein n=1 Tax=Trametes sanguinea TaxID=158606 RepID=A0ACC1Q6V2_9APHY|nr:hypothetical protein NUW54_g1898 [Trametes sanguinea]
MAATVQDAIMLLGDSLTQGGYEMNGFAAKLAHVYNRKMDVINRGFSGYNTDWILPVFEQCFATQHEQQYVPKVRILVIWFGANDAAPPPKDQHVPRLNQSRRSRRRECSIQSFCPIWGCTCGAFWSQSRVRVCKRWTDPHPTLLHFVRPAAIAPLFLPSGPGYVV